jgi:adenylate cyclase
MAVPSATPEMMTSLRFGDRDADRRDVALLERDILEWEIAACRTLIVLVGASIVMVLAISPAIGRSLATANVLLATIAIVHFLLQRYGLEILGDAPDRHRSLEALRWAAATVEISFASFATLLVMNAHGATWAMTSPVTMIYMLGMVAASFRLRPWMAIYAALMSCAQWMLIYYLAILPRLDESAIATMPTLRPWAAWERACWILLTGGLLAVAAHRLRRLALANRKQSRLRLTAEHELERFVSPDVASRALAGDIEPGTAERRWVTVLFCDLRDFTALCEHRRAEEALVILNAFYDRAVGVVRAHGGHVNKFLGDGVLALFGAPQHLEDHASAALDCARHLVRAADDLRAQGGVWDELQIGVGLDTGDVLLGAVGSQDRLEYTAIGVTVNRAARLQALSATTGRRVILSARTASELGDSGVLLPLGEASIKGVDRPIRIYTPR